MSDIAYQNALAKKARLIKELEEINNFLKLHQKFAARNLPKTEQMTEMPAAPLRQSKDANQSPSRTSIPEKFEPIIRRVLLIAGKPLSRGELLKTLATSGHPVPGENPAKNLGTIMWRLRDNFVNLPSHGYWVSGVGLPGVGYEPLNAKTLSTARDDANNPFV